jgi:hypothetical protein
LSFSFFIGRNDVIAHSHCSGQIQRQLDRAAGGGAIARGWRKARPKDELDLLPMSDGGDGFGEVLSGLLGASQAQRDDARRRASSSALCLVVAGENEDGHHRIGQSQRLGHAGRKGISSLPA